MTTINHYSLYCQTETANVLTWSPTLPTTCPNNNTHTIDPDSIAIIGSVGTNVVSILEEPQPTQGNYRANGYSFTAAAGPNVTTTYNISYPYPVNIFDIIFQQRTSQSGDIVNVNTAPNTTIGTLTADIAVGVTVIPVSQTVLTNINLGYILTLTDGTNTNTLGEVITIDRVNGTVTVTTATTNSFVAATPTIIQMTIPRIVNYTIANGEPIVFAGKKIGGSYLPAGVVAQLVYINSTNVDKNVVFTIELVY